MDGISSSAFCDSTDRDNSDFEPWTVSYLKLAVVCMAAWRTAAIGVQLPGKSIPRGTGLLIAGLLASVAGMIFDRVAKVDLIMNARTGQYNRPNIYFPVRQLPPATNLRTARCANLCQRTQVNYMCMSFIAYATGAQLVMKNYRGLGKRIFVTALSISSTVLVVVGMATYVRTPHAQAHPHARTSFTGTVYTPYTHTNTCIAR